VGVVFRRGPTKLVRLILWNREHDTFKLGPWFKGRLYPERSDVSPDGRHLIYFAMGGVAWAIPATNGTWTAISRLPSLTALALWGQGDTWGGGGMFTSNQSYWLNADANTFLVRDDAPLWRDRKRPAGSRRELAGWKTTKPWLGEVSEKAMPKGWVLRRIARYPKRDRYELEQAEHGHKLVFPAWEWADWDRKRLAGAECGCLRAAALSLHKLGAVSTLYDFNAIMPPRKA
jgi:hypothetical protein